MTTLAEQLGFDKSSKLLIINADDFGLNYSTNTAVKDMLVKGTISSTSLMIPCAYARDGALWSKENPNYDVGIHFTFTSEWEKYKWRPLTINHDIQSLVNDEGFFYSNGLDFEQHAVSSHVRQELLTQMEVALQMGLKPTHADNHMGSLYGLFTGHHFMMEVLDVCAYYGLPFRLPRYTHPHLQGVVIEEMAPIVSQMAALADAKAVVIPDYLHTLPFELQEGEDSHSYEQQVENMIKQLPSGVTEVYIHPSIKSSELEDFHKESEKRVLEYEVFNSDFVQRICKQHNVQLINWKMLQQLQRSQTNKDYTF